jgi:hypothetical protein
VLVDLEVAEGVVPDRNVTGVTSGLTIGDAPAIDPLALALSVSDGLTLGESISASLDDLVFSVSDGITIGESVDVDVVSPGIPISLDLGVDNESAWIQGVVVYG